MEAYYEEVFFVGGTGLILNCIVAFKEKYDKILTFFLDEDEKDSERKRRICKEYEINHILVKRKEIEKILYERKKKCIVFSIMNKYIFSKDIVEKENIKIVNLHHSSLPGHRGLNAGAWAIYYQEKYSGVTWHYVDVEVDKGKCIKLSKIFLDDNITAFKLLKKQNEIAFNDFLELMSKIMENKLKTLEYEEGGKGYLHLKDDTPNKGILSLHWNGAKMSAFLRAMDFGGIDIFLRPRIIIGDKDYSWKKYYIEKTGVCENDIRFEGKNIIIDRKDGYKIQLIDHFII